MTGGSITVACLAYLLRDSQYVFVFAFLIGTAWSHILQKIRTKVTKVVEAALGDAGKGGQPSGSACLTFSA